MTKNTNTTPVELQDEELDIAAGVTKEIDRSTPLVDRERGPGDFRIEHDTDPFRLEHDTTA